MEKRLDVSVIIPTYNRASMLESAIESVLRQVGDQVTYELIVVDNNSDDDTRSVVENFIRCHENVRYLFEKERGVSRARNCGIINTSADIVAFLDDDVVADATWISTIKRSLDLHPEVLFVGGKVIPRWSGPPPSWLTVEHWSPLALVDHGDEEFLVDRNRQCCLITANLGVRRFAFEQYGLFMADLKRCEDHEFETRIYRRGGKGLYVPDMVVHADVQNERLKKNYHRAWWSGRGKALARFRAYETGPMSGVPNDLSGRRRRVLGVSPEVYRELARSVIGWILALVARKESRAFYFEAHARDAFYYIVESYRLSTIRRGDDERKKN